MSEASDSNMDDGVEAEVLTLPLDAWHRAQGARMVEFAGYWMPQHLHMYRPDRL